MRETSKTRIVKLMKEVKYEPFPGSLPVTVGDQLPEHAFEAIADHLVKNSIASLPHVQLLEATEMIGPYKMEKIILFNCNQINQETAIRYVEAGEYNPNVVVLEKAQWITMFRDGKPMD